MQLQILRAKIKTCVSRCKFDAEQTKHFKDCVLSPKDFLICIFIVFKPVGGL